MNNKLNYKSSCYDFRDNLIIDKEIFKIFNLILKTLFFQKIDENINRTLVLYKFIIVKIIT